MLRLFSVVFRFLFFVFGLAAGFAAAIMFLPLPGKTFFNRMSRLPNGIKLLIDNSIDLSLACLRLGLTVYKETNIKINQSIDHTKTSISNFREKYKLQRAEWITKNSQTKKEVKNK